MSKTEKILLCLSLLFFLVTEQSTICENNIVPNFGWVSSNTVVEEDDLHFNPNLNLYFVNAVYLPNKINITSPWRLQFQFSLSDCYGSNYPNSVGNGLSVIIQDEPNGAHFVGLDGNNLGYCSSNQCGSNSLAILFDFYGPNNYNQSFIKLVKFSTPLGESLVNGTDPTGNFFPINAETCGVTFDTIVDYDGTNLSLYLESSIPWFIFPINFESMMNLSSKGMAYLGWTMGTGMSTFDLIIHNVTLSQNCENSNYFISKEFCTHFPEYTIVNNTSQFYLNNFSSHNGTSLYLENNISNTANIFFFEKMVITKPWTVQFQFELSKCTLVTQHFNCTGDGFSFIIQGDQRGPFYVGDTGNYLGYFNQTENSMAVLYDFFGHCRYNKQFIRLVNPSSFNNKTNADSLVNASDPTGLFKQTDISKCNSFYSGKVNYNGTHLSVFVVNMDIPWFNYQVNFSSEIILEAGELAYVGWGIGCGTVTYKLTLTNVTTSFYRRNCTIIPQPSSIPEPSPQQNPQQSPEQSPQQSPQQIPQQSPEQHPVPNTGCTSSGSITLCNVQSFSNQTLSNGVFYIQTAFFTDTNLSFNSSTVNFQHDLTISNSKLVIDGNSSLLFNGNLFIYNSHIYITLSTKPLQITKCVSLQNVTVYFPIPPSDTYKQLIMVTPCLSGSINAVVNGSQCYKSNTLYDQTELTVTFWNVCDTDSVRSWPMILGVIVGCCTFVALVIGISFMIHHKIKQKALLESLKLKMDLKTT